jgi:hypothetical protein
VFCPSPSGWSWTFQKDPCNDHGTCTHAARCSCYSGWGPESKLDGTPSCTCPRGWTGSNCDSCELGYIGSHCVREFVVSGAYHDEYNGPYEHNGHFCHGKPVFEQRGANLVLYRNEWEDWAIGPQSRTVDCGPVSSDTKFTDYITSGGKGPTGCHESPDGEGCNRRWLEFDVSACTDPVSLNPDLHFFCRATMLKVLPKGGRGCENARCGMHGVCVSNQPGTEHTCTCLGGYIGKTCASTFAVSGAVADEYNGNYTKIHQICHGQPVFQKGDSEGSVLHHCLVYPRWRIGPKEALDSCLSGICPMQYAKIYSATLGCSRSDSPDDADVCTHGWAEKDVADCQEREPNGGGCMEPNITVNNAEL